MATRLVDYYTDRNDNQLSYAQMHPKLAAQALWYGVAADDLERFIPLALVYIDCRKDFELSRIESLIECGVHTGQPVSAEDGYAERMILSDIWLDALEDIAADPEFYPWIKLEEAGLDHFRVF